MVLYSAVFARCIALRIGNLLSLKRMCECFSTTNTLIFGAVPLRPKRNAYPPIRGHQRTTARKAIRVVIKTARGRLQMFQTHCSLKRVTGNFSYARVPNPSAFGHLGFIFIHNTRHTS